MTIAAFAGGGASEETPAGAPARASANRGQAVFIEQGCGSCHTFKAAASTAPIGPNLDQSLRGKSRDYVLESIVLPNKEFASGFEGGGGAMPEDFAQRIAPQDLDPLVDFLMKGAG